jgi:hypothetical protein
MSEYDYYQNSKYDSASQDPNRSHTYTPSKASPARIIFSPRHGSNEDKGRKD